MKGWGRYRRGRRGRHRPCRGNMIFDIIKFYILLFSVLFGIVFVIIILNKPKTGEEPPAQPPKKIEIVGIKRSTVFKRGLDIINYVWDYNSYKNGTFEGNDIKLPLYLKGKTETKSSGIPYCWGGYLSLDISNVAYAKDFQEAVDRGFTTGNVKCEGGYKDFTAGLDCSGFVSAVYKLPEKCSTETLKYYFDSIDIKDIKPMDIFNSEKNHTFIYIRESRNKKGIITMEATTNGGDSSRDKTVINYRSYEDIKKGINGDPYVPMRYKGIVDDEVVSFKDINEYNDAPEFASNLDSRGSAAGYIDYADDTDYFRCENKTSGNVGISIDSLPTFARVYILDSHGKEIKALDRKGLYSIRTGRGQFFIKITGLDFKHSDTEGYSITVKQ